MAAQLCPWAFSPGPRALLGYGDGTSSKRHMNTEEVTQDLGLEQKTGHMTEPQINGTRECMPPVELSQISIRTIIQPTSSAQP